MESGATDQSHLNIEIVSNVYLLRRKLRENDSNAQINEPELSPVVLQAIASREDPWQSSLFMRFEA